MSKPAAATASPCQLPGGGFRTVLATLFLLPSISLAANPDPALRRSDQLDVRRLGKVSEDERSVLRVEWHAGLAGVEETRSVEHMLDRLRRLEGSIGDVDRLIRDMPLQTPGRAATVPDAAEAPDADGYDIRLAAANLAALALVALWWFRRRKSATRAEAGSASAPGKVAPGAASAVAAPPVPASPATAPSTLTPPAETSLAAPDPAAARAEPVATASLDAQARPSEPFPASETQIFDFSLEAADPEVVARENARLQAARPVAGAPTPARAPQETDVEPTLQLAEIMLSMGLEQGAAQALSEYIEANPRHAVYHCLKLLGIYRSKGLRKEFTETAEKLRKHANIQAEEWGKAGSGAAPTLENFSRVAEHVQKIWTQPRECTDYLRHLLEDNRDGARAGFPQAVAEEILFLIEILKEASGAGQATGT